jgi:hypothetical protein
MKITKQQLSRIIREEKARLLKEYTDPGTSGMMPYAGPSDMEEELEVLKQAHERLKAVRLPAPMDTRIMEALEYIEKAISTLYGDY